MYVFLKGLVVGLNLIKTPSLVTENLLTQYVENCMCHSLRDVIAQRSRKFTKGWELILTQEYFIVSRFLDEINFLMATFFF